MANIYNVKGAVLTEDGLPASGRTVFVYDRTTGNLLRSLTTDSSGEFKTIFLQNSPLVVMALPDSGDRANAQVWDNVIPTYDRNSDVNNIGTPGGQGFGVGVCPNVPTNFEPLDGFDEPSSSNYGNYKYTLDGSIMVWIPAFCYKWGTGSNGLALNDCDIKSYNIFVDEAEANSNGYALHRAFIDGGIIQPGFFVDKYMNSKHPTQLVASSLPLMTPMSSAAADTPFTQLAGTVTNTFYGAVDAAKLRGYGFFCMNIFQAKAIAILSYAHGKASTSTQYCAWWGTTYNFPKGNIASADVIPSSPTYTGNDLRVWAGYYSGGRQANLTGGFNKNEMTTHNGQLSGITDVCGNRWDITPGLTYLSGNFRITKESLAFKNLTSGTSSATDLWATTTNDSIGSTLSDFSTTYGWAYATSTTQIFNEQVDRTSLEYKLTNLGIFKSGNFSTTNNNVIGGGIYRNLISSLCPTSFGYWNNGADAGVWSMNLTDTRTTSHPSCGFRSAFYIL